MAADQSVHGVPPSLSAKVVGYVDSWFNNFVTMLKKEANDPAVSEQLYNIGTVVF